MNVKGCYIGNIQKCYFCQEIRAIYVIPKNPMLPLTFLWSLLCFKIQIIFKSNYFKRVSWIFDKIRVFSTIYHFLKIIFGQYLDLVFELAKPSIINSVSIVCFAEGGIHKLRWQVRGGGRSNVKDTTRCAI